MCLLCISRPNRNKYSDFGANHHCVSARHIFIINDATGHYLIVKATLSRLREAQCIFLTTRSRMASLSRSLFYCAFVYDYEKYDPSWIRNYGYDIHADIFHSHAGHDVTSCFRSALIEVRKTVEMPLPTAFGRILVARRFTCPTNWWSEDDQISHGCRGQLTPQIYWIWRRYLLPVGCNMQLHTALA